MDDCNGRLNFTRTKTTRSSLGSSSYGTNIVGISTRTCSVMSNTDKSITRPLRILSSGVETDSSETNSIQDEPDVSGIIPNPLSEKDKRGLQVNPRNIKSTDFKMMEVGSSSGASNVKLQRKFGKLCIGSNQDTPTGSYFSLGSKTSRSGLHVRSSSNKESSRPSSDQNLSRRKAVPEQKRPEGDRFSATEKKMSGSSSGRNLNGIFIADSHRARNIPPKRELGDMSVRSTILSPPSRNRIHLHESLSTLSQMHQPSLCVDMKASSSAHEQLMSRPNSLRQANSSIGNLQSIRPLMPGEVTTTRSFVTSDNFRRLHIDRIYQMLSALERIQQDEQLTYEQLFLETNLLLSELNFHDQHRDMRLDIDNMSYEELLALEERMGSVSTALSEEEMKECLKRSIYHSTTPEGEIISFREDSEDFKCCICQEEYASGDEIGSMQCKHKFHVGCIQKWLQFKNWCPVCKSSATIAESSGKKV